MPYHRPFLLLAPLIFTAAPSGAFAQEPTAAPEPPPPDASPAPGPSFHRGFQLGARLGYAMPTGMLGGGALSSHLSDLETASVPVGLDAGVRLTPRVYVGGTATWGPGVSPNLQGPCRQSGVSCFEHDLQARAEARFYFAPEARTTGWFAVGVGWEVATFSQSSGSRSVISTLTGPILPDLQLGFDVRSRSSLAIGPYFGVTASTFVTDGVNPPATQVATWVANPSPHTWITLGLRGSYGPW